MAFAQYEKEKVVSIELVAHLYRFRDWQERTFGPSQGTAGVIDHLKKEIAEVEAAPTDLEEWIDIASLAFAGALRAGYTPEQVADMVGFKQAKNECRKWPDWRTRERGKAVEHVRTALLEQMMDCYQFGTVPSDEGAS